MRICEVMSSPVVTVQPDTQLKDVAATLIEHGINAAPVIDASDRLVGIVSEADLLSLEPPPGPGSVASWSSRHTVREVMSQSVYTLTEQADVAAAAWKSASRRSWTPCSGWPWPSTAASSPSTPISARSAASCSRGWPAGCPA